MEEIVSFCRDGTFCRDPASVAVSMCFSHLGYMVKYLPGKAESRLHVHGIPARRDDFLPYNHRAGTIFTFSLICMRNINFH